MDNQRLFLSFKYLFGYLEASPTSRCISEGESIINSNHLITCGLLEKTSTVIKLFALCLKTSALLEKPHEIRGTFKRTSKEVAVSEFACTCKAGLSKRCKHVAAVLILCSRNNILDFPTLSSTDLACYWNKTETAGKYKAAPLEEHKCLATKAASTLMPVKEIEGASILSAFTNAFPESAIAKHRIGRRVTTEIDEGVTLPKTKNLGYLEMVLRNCEDSVLRNIVSLFPTNDCCKKTYEEICKVDIAALSTETQHNRQQWFKERQFRITGSRCYSIFTYSLNDWEMKAKKYFWPKMFTNKYTTHGIQFEAAARNAYSTRNGVEVFQTGLIINKHHPWLAYSPDRIVIRNQKAIKLLEIKCPFAGKNSPAVNFINTCKYLYFDDREGFLTLKKTHSYYAQVQLGMAILNLKECDFILYASFDSSFLNIIIKYDEEYTNNLIQRLQYNYFNKMLHVVCTNKME